MVAFGVVGFAFVPVVCGAYFSLSGYFFNSSAPTRPFPVEVSPRARFLTLTVRPASGPHLDYTVVKKFSGECRVHSFTLETCRC